MRSSNQRRIIGRENARTLFGRAVRESRLSDRTKEVLLKRSLSSQSLLRLLRLKHPTAFKHSMEVAFLSNGIYSFLPLRLRERVDPRKLLFEAKFHDIGKIMLSPDLLAKKGLSQQEQEQIRTHPSLGATLMQGIIDKKERLVIQEHQEEINGKGYPKGLRSEQIPIADRILAVADAYSAMTQARGYNIPKSPEEALWEIVSLGGERYDPIVVQSFKKFLLSQGVKV